MLFHDSFGCRGESPANPAVIFLHGFLGSRFDWLPVIERLRDRFFCIALDLPGHGLSPYRKGIFDAVKNSVASFPRESLLVGYSLGGRIALQLLTDPDLSFAGGMLVSSHPGLSSDFDRERRIKDDLEIAEKIRKTDPPEFLLFWYGRPVFQSLRKKPELLQTLLAKRMFDNREEKALVLEEMSLGRGRRPDPFPENTVFFYGEEDPVYKNIYESLPSCLEKREIPLAVHTILTENPGRLAAELEQKIEIVTARDR